MTARFSIIPAGAVTDRTLEPRDLQVLCLLGRHTDKLGWCMRSQVKMAAEIDCGRSSVQRSIDRLCDAGWVQRKRRDGGAEDTQPSSSYAYRVVLDRDDFAFENAVRDASELADESHAESASREGQCPPVGTSAEGVDDEGENQTEGAQRDGHPGAQPVWARGAQPYMGTKNVPLERSPLEREREARARDRTGKFISEFEKRWPSAAGDSRQRLAYAAAELSEAEQGLALKNIQPFLDHLKKLGRKAVPAGSTYLEEKRWELLDQAEAKAAPTSRMPLEPGTTEARAITVLYAVGRATPIRSKFGQIIYTAEVTQQLLIFATAPTRDRWEWIEDRQQIAAWRAFIDTFVKSPTRLLQQRNGASGIFAPWAWPPRKDGTLSAQPPQDQLMSADDAAFLDEQHTNSKAG